MCAVNRFVLAATAALLVNGCASSGIIQPQPFPRPSPGIERSDPRPGDRVDARTRLVDTALALRGSPYQLGGNNPREGFDCSGFTRYVFASHGIALPRLAAEQFAVGSAVPITELHPGDLVFFTTSEPGVSHVGMAIGGNRFVHAPSQGRRVRIDHLSAGYWARRYVGARRVVD